MGSQVKWNIKLFLLMHQNGKKTTLKINNKKHGPPPRSHRNKAWKEGSVGEMCALGSRRDEVKIMDPMGPGMDWRQDAATACLFVLVTARQVPGVFVFIY